jgi:hypothetical protein
VGNVESKKLLDGGGVGGVDEVLGLANQIFQTAEEEDFEASGLGNGVHRGIVTRARGWG